MRQRLADCGGSCEISTAPARGTATATLTPLGVQFFVTVEGLSGAIRTPSGEGETWKLWSSASP